ncbi:hypothetical protein SAMN05660297_01445 [Natronincola peptidivorans]|uniref:Uncharacterized protein n=1 Tax=Natronincola peptidivorans TaxID=426128 RepID=A0A1I0BXH2_9FIRM|nr:hypothetical protein [Natronincola peptidivorans]SET11213.1 hypothetical protein SAMN05660297_01445 [Natronincola peptidivorans]
MTFFNNLGKKIGSAAEATANKAKEVAEVTKLNAKITEEEKQIEKLYTEIGKAIFKSDKENPESPVAELCDKVLSAQRNIQQLKEKIEEIKVSKEKEPEEAE